MLATFGVVRKALQIDAFAFPNHRGEQLGLNPQEVAFYDVLANSGDQWIDDPRLKDVDVEIVRSLVNPAGRHIDEQTGQFR